MAAADALERYRKSVEIGMRDEDRLLLRDTEKRIKLLESYKAFFEIPAVRDFADWAARDIRSINETLSTSRELHLRSSEERLAMIDRKDVLLYLIGLFDPSAELETLEKELTEKAERFEEYQAGRS